MKYLKLILVSFFFYSTVAEASDYVFNRAPLEARPYVQLPLGSIEARGWIKEQLNRQRNGLTGHLDEIYPEVMGKRNGWLGGDGDVWERGPYWIDGLLPLAYILNDKQLKEKVQPWIDWILASQQADGYFGPSEDRPYEFGLQRDNSHDWWPKMVVLKILQQYYSATGDQRVIKLLTNYFRYQLRTLPEKPLGHWTFWGQRRGGDNLMIVYWLYNITGESFLLDLAELIHKQTFDWTGTFEKGEVFRRQLSLHCVNLGQGFKEPVVYYQQSHQQRHLLAPKEAMKAIRTSIGLPTGLWAGDELLRFGDPTLGSELCTAVEMMFSLEEMLQISADVTWADHLERVAYNALPTQITDDYSSRQYFQQTNQIACSRTWRNFSTPHDDTDNLFGVLNGYPCCTSNMHQAWPKLVQNLWYATPSKGLAALVYAPSSVLATVGDETKVSIVEDTNYPFDGKITFTFSFPKAKKSFSTEFSFDFRIPEWCNQPEVKINGEACALDVKSGQIVTLKRTWKQGDVLEINLPEEVTTSTWFDGAKVVERGPLVYALKLNEIWQKKEFAESEHKRYGKWYYEVTTDSPWNFALPSAPKFEVNKKNAPLADYPWNQQNAPITIETKAYPLYDWIMDRGSTARIAYFTQQGKDHGEEQTIQLIPYGCTTLRITEFPVRQ